MTSAPVPKPVDRARAALFGGLLAALAAATAVTYGEVAELPFVDYDDYVYVVGNAELRSGLDADAIRRAFATTYGLRSNWIPLTALSFQMDYELYGSDAGGYHVTNLVLHIASTLLLLVALTRMTGALGRSAFVAGVFALHPLHVESVAWVAERKDVLSGFFFALTLCAYERYVRGLGRPRARRWYLLTLLSLACGLLSKPMLVTLPAVLFLLDVWPLERIGIARAGIDRNSRRHSHAWGPLVVEKLPMVVLVAVASGVTFAVQGAAGTVMEAEEVLGFPARLMNAVDAYRVYLAQAFWPSGLAVFYPHPLAKLPLPGVLGSALLLLFVTALALWLARRKASRAYLPVGWFWYLGTLIPVIGLVQVGFQAHADRYMYLPLIGLAMMVAWGARDLVRSRFGDRGVAKIALAVAALAVLLACAATTRRQVRHWRGLRALFEHTLAVTEGNFFAHNVLADEYLRLGEYDVAQRHYRAARQLRPNWVAPDRGVGDVAAARGDLGAAILHYKTVLVRHPNDVPLLNHFATAMMRAGRFEGLVDRLETLLSEQPGRRDARLILAEAFMRMGQPEAAIPHYRLVVSEAPDHAEAHDLLGLALVRAGRVDEAESHHAAAARTRPDWVVAQLGLARVESERGEFDAAIARYRRWLPMSPQPATYRALGQALLRAGRLGEAEAHFQTMISLHPDWPEAHFGLGQLATAQGDREAAIGHFESGLELDPDRGDAHGELGSLYAQQGDSARARVHLKRQRALGIRSPALQVKLGLLAQGLGDPEEAIASYRAALDIDATDRAAMNNLAWILATSDRSELRKPRASLRIAERMMRDWPDAGANPLDTLAAAQASTGQFEQAAETALRASQLARRAGNETLAAQIQSRAALYRSGRAFEEAAPRAPNREPELDSEFESEFESE